MQHDLEALFERYRSCGDIDALGEVFDRTAPALCCIALHLCGNRQDAEDAVQATYLRAFEATIGGLPTRYQPVLRLHLLDGHDPIEIAAVLERRGRRDHPAGGKDSVLRRRPLHRRAPPRG